jgi:hypothetical protein
MENVPLCYINNDKTPVLNINRSHKNYANGSYFFTPNNPVSFPPVSIPIIDEEYKDDSDDEYEFVDRNCMNYHTSQYTSRAGFHFVGCNCLIKFKKLTDEEKGWEHPELLIN